MHCLCSLINRTEYTELIGKVKIIFKDSFHFDRRLSVKNGRDTKTIKQEDTHGPYKTMAKLNKVMANKEYENSFL